MRARTFLLGGLPIAISALLYASALTHEYVWDDLTLFVNSTQLNSWPPTWDAVSRPILDGSAYLRPVVLLSFAFEFHFFGQSALVSHAVNYGIHLLNVLLVFALGHLLFSRANQQVADWRACLAASLYAMHPVLSEPVTWVSGRFDLLATTFVLAALCLDRVLKGIGRLVALAICFALALGSKELGIVLPVLLLGLRLMTDALPSESGYATAKRVLTENMAAVITLGAVVLCYFVIRVESLGVAIQYSARSIDRIGNFDRIVLVFQTLAFYFREVVFPFDSVGPFHPLVKGSLLSMIGLAWCAVGIVIIALTIALIRKRVVAGWLLLCALATLAPVLNIVPMTIGGNIGHDRFLTLPLSFMALAIATVRPVPTQWLGIGAQRLGAGVIGVAWALACVLCTLSTIPLWKDELTLWSWVYRIHPDYGAAQLQFVNAAYRLQRFDLLEPAFNRLISENGGLETPVQLVYGAYLIDRGNLEDGEGYLGGALASYPHDCSRTASAGGHRRAEDSQRLAVAFGYAKLAEAALRRGNAPEALSRVETAIQCKSDIAANQLMKATTTQILERRSGSDPNIDAALAGTQPLQRDALLLQRQQWITAYCAAMPETESNPVCDHAKR